jgi:uncharacterized protein
MTAENLQLWLLLTSAASLGVALLLLIPPRCRACKTRMVKLSESGDDLHLEPEEQAEEQLGSINYDVWMCNDCGRIVKRRWRNFLAKRV